MNLSWLQSHFENSSSIGLLRAKHAPFLIDFFLQQFKGSDATVTGEAIHCGMHSLTQAFRDYQERLWETHPDVLTGAAQEYLAEWSGPNKRYLRRFLDSGYDEPLFELTASTESVLTFLDEVARREQQFVGTESRLKRIIDTLADLAIGASDDAEQRLRQLREQRETIDQEIRKIESGGDVQTYRETAIRERFAVAVMDLIQLQGDFRAVEDRFKDIAKDVQKQQLVSDATRGEILGDALDAEEALKNEDQGVSFDEFARLILSPTKQEHLESIIRHVTELQSLAADHDGLDRLGNMVPVLTAEARKVLRTYQRLSTTLRRLLDRDARSERKRLGQVLDEIRSLAVQVSDNHDRDNAFALQIDHQLDVFLPLERTFWSPPTEFDPVALRTHKVDDDARMAAFSDLALLKSLDWARLRLRIREGLESGSAVRLPELIQQSQSIDAVNVMGLIQIAHEDDHEIDATTREKLLVRLADGREALLDIPAVIFRAKQEVT